MILLADATNRNWVPFRSEVIGGGRMKFARAGGRIRTYSENDGCGSQDRNRLNVIVYSSSLLQLLMVSSNKGGFLSIGSQFGMLRQKRIA